MNLSRAIGTAAKVGGAFLSGGVYAAVGAVGAMAGEKAVKIMTPVMDYAVFDPENGYFKDFPDRRDDGVAKRLWTIATYKDEEVN